MVEGTFAENHGSGLEDGLLGGRDAGKIVKEILDTLYGKKGSTDDDDDQSKSAQEREAAPDVGDQDDGSAPAKPAKDSHTAGDESP
jgi:hypothetical protein